jgi:hypothetical protein
LVFISFMKSAVYLVALGHCYKFLVDHNYI